MTDKDVLIELERILSKLRFTKTNHFTNSRNKLTGKKEANTAESILVETQNKTETLSRLWLDNQDRLVYNEITGRANFSKRRPTDYRHNKLIKLPRHIDADNELACETRRRKIMSTFKKFVDMNKQATNNQLNKKRTKLTL